MTQPVMFVSTGLDAGGAETALLRLSRRLTELGTRCGVISLGDEGLIGPELRRSAIPVWCLRLGSAIGCASALSRLRGALATLRPTVVQGWMYHGNLAATVAARLMHPAPTLAWSVRQSLAAPSLDRSTTRMAIRLNAFLSLRADMIIYNSSVARAGHEAAGFSYENGTVIPNGFDVDAGRCDPKAIENVRTELQVPRGAPLIGHLGRWHAVKDHQTLLEAAARVIQQCDKAVFALAGDGVDDHNRELNNAVGALGLQRSIRLLGCRTDVSRLQSAFDIACLSSRAESFPNAIGEAMSAGVPCVSTAVGDVADLIADTGRIVPVGNADALGAALLELIGFGPAKLRELGNRARQRVVDHYSINRVAEQYSARYEDLCAARSGQVN